jgi:hypothetical protein
VTTIYPDSQYTEEGTDYNGGFNNALDPDAAIDEELRNVGDAPAPVAQDLDIDEDEGQEDTGSRASKSGSKPNNRAQFRRVAQKALDVDAASETARTIAASVLGCPSAAADLAAYIMSAPRQSSSPLSDITQVADEIVQNPLLAGITPASWELPRLRAVWAVLHGLGEEGLSWPARPVNKKLLHQRPLGLKKPRNCRAQTLSWSATPLDGSSWAGSSSSRTSWRCRCSPPPASWLSRSCWRSPNR